MLIDFVLKKRIIVLLLAVVLLLAGYISYTKLPLEAYPDIANMQVRVITKVPGKAAEEVERLVTVPIEKELNGIPHAQPPRSVSIFGLSVITVVFDDGVEANLARQQVLEKLTLADLPDYVRPQLDPNASPVGEIYRYLVKSKNTSAAVKFDDKTRLADTMRVKEWQDWVLDRKIKSVPGIIDITGFGGPVKSYQIELDPPRMKALNISQDDVESCLSQANGSTGGSFIVRNDQDFMVRGLGLLRNSDDINNIVVSSSPDGTPVLIKDIADVTVTPSVRVGQVGINNDDDVVEGIILMRRGENPSTAVANLMQSWHDIAGCLPSDMELVPLYDRTALVRKTVETIGHSVVEGIGLVVVCLLLLLFQFRGAAICAAVIPLALSFAFIALNVFGIPGNLLSLGAIDFGIIVDGAIVMVENVIRHLSRLDPATKDPQAVVAAVGRAAREVYKPIIFATSIIIVTFLPILTFQSVEGKLFRPLALTMNFNLIGAVLVSLTIIPVLCAVIYKIKRPAHRTSPLMDFATRLYKPVLAKCLANRKAVVAGAILVSMLGFALAPMTGSEFMPELEEGNIWLRVTVLPTSVSIDKSVEIARQIRTIVSRHPEVTNVISQIGSSDDGTDPNNYSNIEIFVDLKSQDQWPTHETKQELVACLDKELQTALPGLLYNFSQYIKDSMDETISGVKGELAAKVYGGDLSTLTELGRQIKHTMADVPGIVDVAADELVGQPQIVVDIDRLKAARYGINTQSILDVVETSVGGRALTTVSEGERRFCVVLRYKSDYRNDSHKFEDILVKSKTGATVPLAEVATIKEELGAAAILRDDNQRRIAIKANIRGRDLCSAAQEAREKVAAKVQMPEGYRIEWSGQFERAQHAAGELAIVIPITLLLVFSLLYAATSSARVASLVMLSVPLSIPGGMLALLLTHTHMSISAGVGFIALAGVSIQNGVILVSLVSELEKQGVELGEAVVRSAVIRMQPALMTTFVALAGLIPAAMATGIGSQSQKPFAIVIAGGLLPAILLSLIVLPSLYQLFNGIFRPQTFKLRSMQQVESVEKEVGIR